MEWVKTARKVQHLNRWREKNENSGFQIDCGVHDVGINHPRSAGGPTGKNKVVWNNEFVVEELKDATGSPGDPIAID